MDTCLHNDDEFIKKHSKLTKKLSFINLITTTLICIAPTLWLILRIVTNQTEKLLITTIFTIPTLIYMTYTWCSYFYTKKIDKLEELLDELEKEK